MLEDAFPSSLAFDAINSSLQSDDAERKDAIKKGNAIFAFTLKNKEGQTDSWYIDLKEKGAVAKGDAPEGKKADGEPTRYLTFAREKESGRFTSFLPCCITKRNPMASG